MAHSGTSLPLFKRAELRCRFSHRRHHSRDHDFPFIISVSREALLAVPREQREAAPGARRHAMGIHLEGSGAVGATGIMGRFFSLWRARWAKPWLSPWSSAMTRHHASLFAPGYTIAAVIANEFTEATGDLYLSALIELGLVLFLITFILTASRGC